MPSTAHRLPAHLFALYPLEIHPIDRLDDSGEDCRYCQEQDRYVEVQAYATSAENGLPVSVSSCCTCLGQALFLAGADLLERVVVEFEKCNPVSVAA